MRRKLEMLLLLAVLTLFTSTVFAAFPYSAPWLKYADMRIIYEVNTASITQNEANIYVTIDIDPQTLQSYINKWSMICDASGKYDWFYPTFTYASSYNTTERMIQVVSAENWQTFTVGSCGEVNLPTRYVVKMPNGVLDGNADYGSYTHYIYAYLKKPFSEDFYDDYSGIDEYSNSVSLNFSNTFGQGYYAIVKEASSPSYRSAGITVDLNSNTPSVLCYYVSPVTDDYVRVYFKVSSTTVYRGLISGEYCFNIEPLLRSSGLSGKVTIDEIGIASDAYLVDEGIKWYWYWLIPDSIIQQALRSGN